MSNKVADHAVDYGDSWVVAEITTSVLRRESIAGISDEDVEKDFDKFGAKVEQIDSTINQLRTDSQRLTGHAANTRVMTFYPVLVLAEGFPGESDLADDLEGEGQGGGSPWRGRHRPAGDFGHP